MSLIAKALTSSPPFANALSNVLQGYISPSPDPRVMENRCIQLFQAYKAVFPKGEEVNAHPLYYKALFNIIHPKFFNHLSEENQNDFRNKFQRLVLWDMLKSYASLPLEQMTIRDYKNTVEKIREIFYLNPEPLIELELRNKTHFFHPIKEFDEFLKKPQSQFKFRIRLPEPSKVAEIENLRQQQKLFNLMLESLQVQLQSASTALEVAKQTWLELTGFPFDESINIPPEYETLGLHSLFKVMESIKHNNNSISWITIDLIQQQDKLQKINWELDQLITTETIKSTFHKTQNPFAIEDPNKLRSFMQELKAPVDDATMQKRYKSMHEIIDKQVGSPGLFSHS